MWPSTEERSERPPIIERVTEPQELLARIIESLDGKDSLSLKTYILEHKLKEESITWDLILKIGECITAEQFEKEPGFFEVCVRCLTYLVNTGNPKETLLAILEQMDTFIDDVKYKTFLPLVLSVLMKIPGKRFHSLDIALETISSHVRGISPPENVQLEGKEVKAFHLDQTVVRLADVMEAFLNFLEPFTESLGTGEKKSELQTKFVLKKHLLRLLNYPLCHLVLTFSPDTDRVESSSRLCAEKTMQLLTRVETDFHRLMKSAQNVPEDAGDNILKKDEEVQIENEERDNVENEMLEAEESMEGSLKEVKDIVEQWDVRLDFSPLGQACLAYLIHYEHLGIDKFPFIYTHLYMFESHLDSISLLLQNTNYAINFKGLLLCKALVNCLTNDSILDDDLDNPGYFRVFNDLIYVMVKCPVSDHRAEATQIFPKLISKFDPEGRYHIYHALLASCSHSSLKGYIITLLKNDIATNLKLLKELKQKTETSGSGDISQYVSKTKLPSEVFAGNQLRRILHLALKLAEGETTDMLENSNQIISGLNLLRFLFLADTKETNITGVWDSKDEIDKIFISPLRTGLDLSKAHYKLELETVLKEGSGVGQRSKATPKMDVSVGGMTLPQLEHSEKMDMIHKAINTHDVMLSLVARVTELVEMTPNK